MSSLEDELKDLREKNNELVQKVQYWKMTAAEKDNEKLKLMKEANELRLKLSTLRNKGSAHAQKLEAALQSASEEALSHLVQGSNAIARIIELIKSYMQEREEIDFSVPRWSNIGNTPSTEKVHRVPPLMLGGRSIQPVVSLSRTLLTNNSWTISRRSNESHNGTERALPMRMLQDVYIPLTRIDAVELTPPNVDMGENNGNTSTEDMGLDDDINDRIPEVEEEEEDAPVDSDSDDFENMRSLDVVLEDSDESQITPQRSRIDNPLEGPSWLLDAPNVKANGEGGRAGCEFTPTVRRRKRPPSPPSPRAATPRSPILAPSHTKHSSNSNGRILKVLVAKMSLNEDESDATPPKKQMTGQTRNVSHRPGDDSDSSRDSLNTSRNNTTSTQDKFRCKDARTSYDLYQADASPHRICQTRPNQTQDTSRDDSPTTSLRMSRDSPSKFSRDVKHSRRRSRDSPGGLSRDVYRMSQDSHSSAIKDLDRFPVFDAPSPNGSTDTRVIVQEATRSDSEHVSVRVRRDSLASGRSGHSDHGGHGDHGGHSDCSDGEPEARTRRARKPIVYKEKPLNRKMRR